MEKLETLPPVAKNVFLECKKCGVDRYLKVVTHVDDKRFKAKCEVCHSTRTHSIAAKKKTTRRKPAGKSSGGPQAWLTLKEKIGDNQVQGYNMKGRFEADSAIQHPKFGLGFIVASNSQSIDVQFEDSVRSLVHNRAN